MKTYLILTETAAHFAEGWNAAHELRCRLLREGARNIAVIDTYGNRPDATALVLVSRHNFEVAEVHSLDWPRRTAKRMTETLLGLLRLHSVTLGADSISISTASANSTTRTA